MHLSKATGAHFNEKGHGLQHMKVTIIEKVKKMEETYKKEIERFFIQKFNTYNMGMNRQP